MEFWSSALEGRFKLRILVTGNLGYVGSHIMEFLIQDGHEVVGCDLFLFQNAICGDLPKPSLQIHRDFRQLTASDLKGIDAIAHMAGLSNDPMGDLDPGLTMQVNGKGTLEFARIAREAGVRIFAFASSCSIYGNTSSLPRTELDETSPLSEYASSKLYAEQGLSKLATDSFHVYLLRNATAFGDSNVFRSDLVVNDLSVGMSVFGKAEIKSDGTPWRPLIHAKDMARAFKLFMEQDPIEISGKPINIGFNRENFQIREVGNIIKSAWDKCEITLNTSATFDPRDYKVDFSQLERLFPGFKPEHPLVKGVHELKSELMRIGYSIRDHESKRFVRLHELKSNISKLSN